MHLTASRQTLSIYPVQEKQDDLPYLGSGLFQRMSMMVPSSDEPIAIIAIAMPLSMRRRLEYWAAEAYAEYLHRIDGRSRAKEDERGMTHANAESLTQGKVPTATEGKVATRPKMSRFDDLGHACEAGNYSTYEWEAWKENEGVLWRLIQLVEVMEKQRIDCLNRTRPYQGCAKESFLYLWNIGRTHIVLLSVAPLDTGIQLSMQLMKMGLPSTNPEQRLNASSAGVVAYSMRHLQRPGPIHAPRAIDASFKSKGVDHDEASQLTGQVVIEGDGGHSGDEEELDSEGEGEGDQDTRYETSTLTGKPARSKPAPGLSPQANQTVNHLHRRKHASGRGDMGYRYFLPSTSSSTFGSVDEGDDEWSKLAAWPSGHTDCACTLARSAATGGEFLGPVVCPERDRGASRTCKLWLLGRTKVARDGDSERLSYKWLTVLPA
ncbi:hypothetical protein BKA70DRAFT_1404328 [Coprinopsis sp. MPI-PUGE-AT-0042]|nr:hypothetical protein BKA70DRAFT_1404328 [Coprinopsis sp. MPI-PUGE-AT-0042]